MRTERSSSPEVAEALAARDRARRRWNEVCGRDADLHDAAAAELLAAERRLSVALREVRGARRGRPGTIEQALQREGATWADAFGLLSGDAGFWLAWGAGVCAIVLCAVLLPIAAGIVIGGLAGGGLLSLAIVGARRK